MLKDYNALLSFGRYGTGMQRARTWRASFGRKGKAASAVADSDAAADAAVAPDDTPPPATAAEPSCSAPSAAAAAAAKSTEETSWAPSWWTWRRTPTPEELEQQAVERSRRWKIARASGWVSFFRRQQRTKPRASQPANARNRPTVMFGPPRDLPPPDAAAAARRSSALSTIEDDERFKA